MFFVFSALLEYALVNYASRSDAQRLAKLKSKKQLELDHCAARIAFDDSVCVRVHDGKVLANGFAWRG